MKHSLFILFICCAAVSLFAQSNLQFVQSKLISNAETVPIGKTWKVEGFIYSSQIATFYWINNTQNLTDLVTLNGNSVAVRISSCAPYGYPNSGGSIIWEQHLPLWLPEGTSIAASTGVLYVNVLEFNEIP